MRYMVQEGEVAPKVPRHVLRESKGMLIMGIDFKEIAFWHLCEEKYTVTSVVYKSFLQTFSPEWMI
jgi:aminoglycoside N3'-acetyltransferase